MILCVLVFSIGLSADSAGRDWKKWEIAIGGSLQTAPINASIATRYFPPFDRIHSVDPVAGLGEQVIDLDHKRALNCGFTVELTRFLSQNSGVQLLGVFHNSPLKAQRNRLFGDLYFTYYIPGDNLPKTGSREYNMDWADETTGTLKRNTYSLNLFKRLRLGNKLELDLSGGVTFFRLKGDFTGLGYNVYVTDKASLYLSSYRLKTAIDSINRLGANFGVKLLMPLGERMALFVSGRYFWATKVTVDTDYVEISNYDSGTDHDAFLAEIRTTVAPRPIKLNPSFLSIAFGVNVGF